jgi:hypothetical protein
MILGAGYEYVGLHFAIDWAGAKPRGYSGSRSIGCFLKACCIAGLNLIT